VPVFPPCLLWRASKGETSGGGSLRITALVLPSSPSSMRHVLSSPRRGGGRLDIISSPGSIKPPFWWRPPGVSSPSPPPPSSPCLRAPLPSVAGVFVVCCDAALGPVFQPRVSPVGRHCSHSPPLPPSVFSLAFIFHVSGSVRRAYVCWWGAGVSGSVRRAYVYWWGPGWWMFPSRRL